MKVRDIMTADPVACQPTTPLAEASTLMFEHDFGILPVLDRNGRLMGVLTDRDVCMSVGRRHQKAAQTTAQEVMTPRVYSCRPDDDVKDALNTMKEKKVRRLPVLDAEGHLHGVLSLNDVVLHADEEKAIPPALIDTLKSVCEHRHVIESA